MSLNVTAPASAENTPRFYKGYESPAYTVTKTLGDNIEIRNYSPLLTAEVRVDGEREKAVNEGFKILAGYIFGDNETKQKVAMTSPVVQKPASEKVAMTSPVVQTADKDDSWIVAFVMPEKFTKKTLPDAKNDRIRFVQTPARIKAVMQFSGFATTSKIKKMQDTLRATLKKENITPRGEAGIAYYDDPFTLPWNRRNEVFFVLN